MRLAKLAKLLNVPLPVLRRRIRALEEIKGLTLLTQDRAVPKAPLYIDAVLLAELVPNFMQSICLQSAEAKAITIRLEDIEEQLSDLRAYLDSVKSLVESIS